VRGFLENFAKRQIPITYQELAKALQILPPHTIHRVTEAPERLMEEDAAADRPFITALAISKARGGLPAPGFFECARRLGRFAGDPAGQDAWSFTRRAERRLRSLGRFARQLTTKTSCSPKLIPRRRTTRTSTSIWARRTRFSVPIAGQCRFDPQLTPLDADPPDSFFADANAA
jgi:hypothetical protein